MQRLTNPEDCQRIVRAVFELMGGERLENIWNIEGLFDQNRDKIKRVIIEAIGRDCRIKTLDEFRGGDVKNIYTATLFYQAMGRNVYVGKTVLLKDGKKITYYIDGQQTNEDTGGKK